MARAKSVPGLKIGADAGSYCPVIRLPRRAVHFWALGATSAAVLAGEVRFTPESGPAGWEATHQVAPLKVGADGLEVKLEGNDPYVTSPALDMGAQPEQQLEFRLRSDSGGWGQVFWFQDHAAEAQSTHFRVRTNAWTDVSLPLGIQGPGWRFRLDPPGTNGSVRVAWWGVHPVGSRGLRRVVGKEAELELEWAAGEARPEVVELAPDDDLSVVGSAQPLTWVGVGEGRGTVPRFRDAARGTGDRWLAGFVARIPDGNGGYRPVGSRRHAEEFESGRRLHPPAVRPTSRKGLQVQMVDDAIALGVQHAALNVNLPGLVDLTGEADSYVWKHEGRDYHFRRGAVDGIPVKALSEAGAAVTLILLAYESGQAAVDRAWLHPDYSRQSPNRLGGFNTATPEGVGWFGAAVGFLAHRFSQPDGKHGRAVNFIIGNEVTAHWYWYNEGEVPAGPFIADYVRTVRLANAAAQAQTDAIRVYLSFDHHWNLTYGEQPRRAIAGRTLLDGFVREAALGGSFEWHLAYHPYPENLFNPRTWLDQTATPDPTSPRITFRNLEVLTRYLRRPELLRNGQVRRVILSEQGFHSDGTEAGEALQAAAYAYAWEKVAASEGIDALILHRHVDHGHEGGLNLGLWRRKPDSISEPGSKKPIYEVFRAADGPDREAAFRFALPLVGLTNWSQLRKP